MVATRRRTQTADLLPASVPRCSTIHIEVRRWCPGIGSGHSCGEGRVSTRVLEFERPIRELEGKIRELKLFTGSGSHGSRDRRLEDRPESCNGALCLADRVGTIQLAKHPDRPYTLDYVREIHERLRGAQGGIVPRGRPAMWEPLPFRGDARGGRGTPERAQPKQTVYRNFGCSPGGVPEGSADHASSRKVRASTFLFHRHVRGISGIGPRSAASPKRSPPALNS